MKKSLSVQLYSFRDHLEHGYTSVIERIAEAGYTAVETAGYPGSTLKEAKKIFTDFGLQVSSMHGACPVGDDLQKVLDEAQTLECNYVVAGAGPQEYSSPDAIERVCERWNEAAANMKEHGLIFAVHNHWWEFDDVEGKPAYKYMFDHLSDDVVFEIDTYWVKVAGCDPAEVLSEMGAKAPLLHIKDGSGVKDSPMLAVGKGVMDFKSIAEASGPHSEWWIVELDHCDTDMAKAIEQSATYLIDNNYVQG